MTIYELPIPEPTIDEALASGLEVIHMCPCSPEDVRLVWDTVCGTCGQPNLAALLAKRWCECDEPDLWFRGLVARNCQTCGLPHKGCA